MILDMCHRVQKNNNRPSTFAEMMNHILTLSETHI